MTLAQSAKHNFLRWQELITALFLASLFLLLKLALFTQLTAIIVTSVFAAIQLIRLVLSWPKLVSNTSYETKISVGCDFAIAFGTLALAITSNFSVDPTLLAYHIAPFLCFFFAIKAIAAIANANIWRVRRNNAKLEIFDDEFDWEIKDPKSVEGAKYNASWYGMVNSICTALAYLGACAFTAIIAFTRFGFGGSLPIESPVYFSFHIGQLFITPPVMAFACFIPLVLFQFYFGLKGDPSQRYERATENNKPVITRQFSERMENLNQNRGFNHQRSQLADTTAPKTLKAEDTAEGDVNDWRVCCCNHGSADAGD